MTYAEHDFEPEPDVLHEVITEDGKVIFESFDLDETQEFVDTYPWHVIVPVHLKSTPV